MESIFTKPVADKVINRIEKLTPATTPQWGKMNVAQMLAHCNVTYELVYEDKHPKPGFFMKIILKTFVKKLVTNETPYKRNSPTSPAFKIVDERVFATEKQRLIEHIDKTQKLGEQHFDGKESISFGKMTKDEWNVMFHKHLDHHLTQFGV